MIAHGLPWLTVERLNAILRWWILSGMKPRQQLILKSTGFRVQMLQLSLAIPSMWISMTRIIPLMRIAIS